MDEYIKREDALDAVLFALVGTGLQSTAIYALRDIPTADVAPKSEVERAYQRGFERGKRDNVRGFSAEDIAQKAENIAIDLEAMRTAANSYKMHYENARAEVAREIFEEIEKVACVYKLDGDFYIDNGLYDELKKKCTGEK